VAFVRNKVKDLVHGSVDSDLTLDACHGAFPLHASLFGHSFMPTPT
jgi:hypothetical protein